METCLSKTANILGARKEAFIFSGVNLEFVWKGNNYYAYRQQLLFFPTV